MNQNRIIVPKVVRRVLKTLRDHGYSVYPVGGAVRDSLRGIRPQDWDLASDARPETIENLFPKTLATGKKFGTITVVEGEHFIQITTFRSESKYEKQRRPRKVSYIGNILDDLARRDFTFNAMAYDVLKKKLLDPFGGRGDLKKRRLRTVGEPQKRFREDHLRLVRAGRFIAQLNVTPTLEVTEGAKNVRRKLSQVSPERIRDELSKLLLASRPEKGLAWLQETGILKAFLPEVSLGEASLEALRLSTPKLNVRLALLLTGESRSRKIQTPLKSESILKRLRFPKHLQKDVQTLLSHQTIEIQKLAKNEKDLRKFLMVLKPQRLDAFLDVKRALLLAEDSKTLPKETFRSIRRFAQKVRDEKQALEIQDLALDGREIMSVLKIPSSPRIGHLLQQLLEEVVKRPKMNQKEVLIRRVKELNAAR